MQAALHHFCRYLCWSLFGALIITAVPVVLVIQGEVNHVFWDRVLLFTVGIGGLLLVIPRALVGAVTGWQPAVADRATAIWIGRFFIGWLAGRGIALFLLLFFPETSSGNSMPGGH